MLQGCCFLETTQRLFRKNTVYSSCKGLAWQTRTYPTHSYAGKCKHCCCYHYHARLMGSCLTHQASAFDQRDSWSCALCAGGCWALLPAPPLQHQLATRLLPLGTLVHRSPLAGASFCLAWDCCIDGLTLDAAAATSAFA